MVMPWTAPLPPPLLLGRLLAARHPVLLDSAADQSGQGDWSFLTCDPVEVIETPAWRPGGPPPAPGSDPFFGLAERLERRRLAPHPLIPFTGGAVGCWSYDLRYRLERLPCLGADDPPLPHAWIGLYSTLYAFDHHAAEGYLVHAPAPGEPPHVGEERLRKLQACLETPRSEPAFRAPPSVAVRSSFTRGDYLRAVERVQEYIAAGDVYQVNLSQRFTAPLAQSPADLYRRLRAASPAPFAAYLDAGRFQVLSSSPERLLRVRGGRVETRPIKGTRPRGITPEEDASLAAELQASTKDRAELVMIVDLERNDLGRVCEYGSVRVRKLLELETHPTVHHLVATVEGNLRPGVSALEALRACFPGGSITGAPKIRAVEIIEELEPVHRGFYTGAIGYAGFDGGAEWNVAIRIMVANGGQVTFSAGGGIVADSVPELEYEETLHKSRAIRQALNAREDDDGATA
jgi:para-aminobenzoate synthetase component 1